MLHLNTYLNVDVLLARVLNEEGEGILPHRVVVPVAGLQQKGETSPNVLQFGSMSYKMVLF